MEKKMKQKINLNHIKQQLIIIMKTHLKMMKVSLTQIKIIKFSLLVLNQ